MDLPKNFKKYLIEKGSSKRTAKNYLSDLNNYFNWFCKKTNTNPLLDPNRFFKLHSSRLLKDYKDSLGSNASDATIKRRFAALKKFDEFAKENNLLSTKPTKNLKPAPRKEKNILFEFKKSLLRENISPTTAKNYLCDINHFLKWLKAN